MILWFYDNEGWLGISLMLDEVRDKNVCSLWNFKNQSPKYGISDGSTFNLSVHYLLVNTHSIQTIIHDVYPAVFGGKDKQGHESL